MRLNLSTDHNDYILIWDLTNGDRKRITNFRAALVLTTCPVVQAIPQVSILKAFLEQHCATGNIALMLDDGEVRVETVWNFLYLSSNHLLLTLSFCSPALMQQGDGWNYCETNVNIIMSNGMSHHGYGAVYSQDRIVVSSLPSCATTR